MIDLEKIPEDKLNRLLVMRQNLDEVNRLFDENKQNLYADTIIENLNTVLGGKYDYNQSPLQNLIKASHELSCELNCIELDQQRATAQVLIAA